MIEWTVQAIVLIILFMTCLNLKSSFGPSLPSKSLYLEYLILKTSTISSSILFGFIYHSPWVPFNKIFETILYNSIPSCSNIIFSRVFYTNPLKASSDHAKLTKFLHSLSLSYFVYWCIHSCPDDIWSVIGISTVP